MVLLRKPELIDLFVRAVSDVGWQVLFLGSGDEHPVRLHISRDDEAFAVRLYIWNMTHGGGRARPAHEYRIQITGIAQFEQNQNERTIILGWFGELDIFAGFDYRFHTGLLGHSPSFQIKEEYLHQAHKYGFASCPKGNNEIAIAFRPDFAVHYVKHLHDLHDFGQSDREMDAIQAVSTDPDSIGPAQIKDMPEPRQTTILQLKKALRDSSFQRRVLSAYNYQCSFCRLQLNLVDAAHIVPVNYEGSTDETSNGIALCSLHHRAFDRALISVDDSYRVILNKNSLDHLAQSGRSGKLDMFLGNLLPEITLPHRNTDRPNADYLRIGRTIRGWPDRDFHYTT